MASVRYVDKQIDKAIEDIGTSPPKGTAYVIGNPPFGSATSAELDPDILSTRKRPSRSTRAYQAVNGVVPDDVLFYAGQETLAQLIDSQHVVVRSAVPDGQRVPGSDPGSLPHQVHLLRRPSSGQ